MLQRNVHRSPTVVANRHRPPWRVLIEGPEPSLAISNLDALRNTGFETADGFTTIRPTTSVGGQVSALRKAALRWPTPRA